MSKITIGITTHNNGVFLKELLYTLDNELMMNVDISEEISIIIYDDCSTEQLTLGILSQYEKVYNIKISKRNSGTPATGRNYIIDNSRSEYILFLDGDDTIVCPIRELYDELSKKSGDLLLSNVVKINNDGIKGESPFLYSKDLFSGEVKKEDILKMGVHQTGIWSIYKVDFLNKNMIRYPLDMRYEDNYFMTLVYLSKPEIDIIHTRYYGWRNNYTSFVNSDIAIKHRLSVYDMILELIATVPVNENKAVPWLFYSIWNQTYVNIIRNYPNMNKREYKKYYQELDKITKKHKTRIEEYLSYLDSKYLDVYTKIITKTMFLQKFFFLNIFRKIANLKRNKQVIKSKLLCIFFLFPINEKKVFFTSHYGDYNDNSKYLYLSMKKDIKHLGKKYVFAVNNPKELNEEYNTNDFIDYKNKLQFFFHHYTAKEIYFNSWYSPHILKRKQQVWKQLWHGIPYKKVYTDVNVYDVTNDQSKKDAKKIAILNWDYVWSVNKYNSEIFEKIFPNAKIIESEYPKTKWLKENINNNELKSKMIKKYELCETEEYILYAPTYRPYKVYLCLKEVLGLLTKGQKLIIHMHPLMNFEWIDYDNDELCARSIRISQISDIQELILVTKGVITDYSSIRYDYQQLGLPCSMYEPDRELYSLLHGLY